MKKNYPVISPVKHDGKRYAIGEKIELDDEQAERLKKSGAVEDVVDSAPAVPTDAAERIAAIVDAIGKLDKADTALWMKSGAPKTESIASITGWPVAGKERDGAWASMQPENRTAA